jgi:hypothetical protein
MDLVRTAVLASRLGFLLRFFKTVITFSSCLFLAANFCSFLSWEEIGCTQSKGAVINIDITKLSEITL